jgi:hypothetical protein
MFLMFIPLTSALHPVSASTRPVSGLMGGEPNCVPL